MSTKGERIVSVASSFLAVQMLMAKGRDLFGNIRSGTSDGHSLNSPCRSREKEGGMEKIIFISFNNEKQAHDGVRALRELRTVTLYAGALIAKDPDGKIVVKESAVERPAATLGGLLMDSLVGLLGPAAIAIDSGSGALLGAAINAAKAGITTEFVQTIETELASGKIGLIAEVDEEWVTPIDIRMEALGATVFRQTRTQLEDAFFEKEIEAQQTELAILGSEKAANAKIEEKQESAERNARLQAKIEATKRKIQEKKNQLAERIQYVKEEGEERIALLQDQKITADEESRIQLDQRLKDIRAEYQLRAKKLTKALERSKRAPAA
jgi:uncharacterized membrane protein